MNVAPQTTNEKPDVAEMEAPAHRGGVLEAGNGHPHQDIALEASALPQFAHLDEKKILRKVNCQP